LARDDYDAIASRASAVTLTSTLERDNA